MSSTDNILPSQRDGKGGNPFETIRRVDAYGREWWDGRELQPLMEYAQWRDFRTVIEKAKASLSLVQGEVAAQNHFAETRNMVEIGSGARRAAQGYRLTRFGAYLVAMAGDDTKQAVALARIYFAVKTREAELGALAAEEIRYTALARAREMIDYRTFRDMMAENATDYVPSSKATGLFFAKMQNKLYLNLVGMTAEEIKGARELQTWPGREDGKPEPSARAASRKVAKNYLTGPELAKLDRIVGRLCLTAEDIAEDGEALSLNQWMALVDTELALRSRPILAA